MKTKTVAYLGIGIALYVVLGCFMNIPLLAGTHLQTDLGYIAFGAYCYLLGWPAFIVGVIGCLIESLLTSGWVPVGWMAGQALIGLTCGYTYKKTQNKYAHIVITVIEVFLGMVLVKSGIECALYGIPLVVKIPKNFVAFIADVIPMLLGLFLGYKLKDRFDRDFNKKD